MAGNGNVSKLPVKTEGKGERGLSSMQGWSPMERLHREINRLFDNFHTDFLPSSFLRPALGVEPFWRGELSWGSSPAVDIIEKENAFEVTAELPGMTEKNIEVKLVNSNLTIKGEKREEKEEKKKDYYLHERSFGSFERSFPVPDSVDTAKIEACFKNGVLTVTLPKKAEARKPEKRIEIKAA